MRFACVNRIQVERHEHPNHRRSSFLACPIRTRGCLSLLPDPATLILLSSAKKIKKETIYRPFHQLLSFFVHPFILRTVSPAFKWHKTDPSVFVNRVSNPVSFPSQPATPHPAYYPPTVQTCSNPDNPKQSQIISTAMMNMQTLSGMPTRALIKSTHFGLPGHFHSWTSRCALHYSPPFDSYVFTILVTHH